MNQYQAKALVERAEVALERIKTMSAEEAADHLERELKARPTGLALWPEAAERVIELLREKHKSPCVIEYRAGDVVVRHEAPTVELLDALLKLDKARQPERVTVVLDTKIVGPSVEEMARNYFKGRAENPDGIPGA